MAEVDFVVPPEITISYEGDIDLKELFYLLKNWLTDRGFFVLEKEHEGDLENFKSKLEASKKVDEYTKYAIKVGLKSSHLKQISIKNKNLYHGEFNVSFESSIESDYEGKWEKKPFMKIFRSFYSKYVDREREENYHKELKEITLNFYNEIKGYFGLKSNS